MKIKKGNSKQRKNLPVSISLPPTLCSKLDERAAALYQNRSEYVKSLVLFDLKLVTIANCENGNATQTQSKKD